MIIIGITDCGKKWQNYHDWLASDEVQVLKLSVAEKNLADVSKCNSIILSGGEDVHPRFYNKPEYLSMLDPKEISEARDEFELKVIERTQKENLPLFGICRGLQIANVYFGGTLIPDLKTSVRHTKDKGIDNQHEVRVAKNSLLDSIVNSNSGMINTAHHQAADIPGNGLKVSARANDNTIEALERQERDGRSFLLLVQWHPERMKEQDSAFSGNLRKFFLTQCLLKKSSF